MTIRYTLAIALAFALTACSDGGVVPRDGGPPATRAADPGDHDKDDVLFAHNLIRHHELAVEMSQSMFEKADIDPSVKAMAVQIRGTRRAEVDQLRIWLQLWGESELRDAGDEPGHFARRHDMRHTPEESTPTQLANLRAARGDDASQMFLTHMVAHGEEAVAMAREEIANGKNPEAIAFARELITDQEAEIRTMRELLAPAGTASLND